MHFIYLLTIMIYMNMVQGFEVYQHDNDYCIYICDRTNDLKQYNPLIDFHYRMSLKPQNDDQDHLQNQLHIHMNNGIKLIKSQQSFVEQYQKYFKQCNRAINIDQINSKWNKNNIQHKNNYRSNKFFCETKQIGSKGEYFMVDIQILKFSLRLYIVNTDKVSPYHTPQERQGNFGDIHFAIYQGQQICIKSYPYNGDEDFNKKFPKILKEVSIYKIASILECSPASSNLFGFDIVIYNDSILYTMQKGKNIKNISPQNLKQLKQQLKLLHSFHIIHADIKPQNIIYSPILQKYVFIDFGFSVIIQQTMGYKTLSSFKGTPQYSSPQMMQTLYSDKKYIDLYYNDYYCLHETQSMISSKFLYGDTSQQKIQFVEVGEANLLRFYYHYVRGERELARRYTRQNGFRVLYFAEILNFMKDVIVDVFIDDVLFEDMKMYAQFEEYKQLRLRSKANFIKMYSINTVEKKNYSEDYYLNHLSYKLQKIQNNLNQDDQQTHNYQEFYQKLTNKQWHSNYNKDIILSLAFQCIRFDQKNLKLAQKSMLSKFLRLMYFGDENLQQKHNIYYPIKEQSQHLREIGFFLYLMLQCCLQPPFITWKKNKLFEISYNLVLLDIDISHKFDAVISFLWNSSTSAIDGLIASLQLDKIQQLIKLKIQKKNIYDQKLYKFCERVGEYSKKYAYNFFIEASNANQQQHQKIYNIISVINQYQWSKKQRIYLSTLKKQVQSISNSRIKEYLWRKLRFHQLSYYIAINQINKIYKIYRKLLKVNNYFKMNIHVYAFHTMGFMDYTQNKIQRMTLFDNIQDFIGSKFITQSIAFDGSQIQQQLVNLCARMITINNQKVNYNRYRQMCYIVISLAAMLNYQPQLIDQNNIYLLKNTFYSLLTYCRIQFQVKVIIYRKLTMLDNVLQLFFNHQIHLIPQVLSVHIKIFGNHIIDQQFSIIVSDQTTFYLMLLRYRWFHHLRRYQKSYGCLGQIVQFCEKRKLDDLKIQFLSKMIKLFLDIYPQKVGTCLIGLYGASRGSDRVLYYFLDQNSTLPFLTYREFIKIDRKQLAVQFLIQLSQFIGKYPLKSYVIGFIKIMQQFYSFQPNFQKHITQKIIKQQIYPYVQKNSYILFLILFSVTSFKLRVEVEEYLKILAKHIIYIDDFSKKMISSVYYQVFYFIYADNQRKNAYLLLRIAKVYYKRSLRDDYVRSKLKNIEKRKGMVLKRKLKQFSLNSQIISFIKIYAQIALDCRKMQQ